MDGCFPLKGDALVQVFKHVDQRYGGIGRLRLVCKSFADAGRKAIRTCYSIQRIHFNSVFKTFINLTALHLAREVECTVQVLDSLAVAMSMRPAECRLLSIVAFGWVLGERELEKLAPNFPDLNSLHILEVDVHQQVRCFAILASKFPKLKILRINGVVWIAEVISTTNSLKSLEVFEARRGALNTNILKRDEVVPFFQRNEQLKSFSHVDWNDETLEAVGERGGFNIEAVELFSCFQNVHHHLTLGGYKSVCGFKNLKILRIKLQDVSVEVLEKIAKECMHLRSVFAHYPSMQKLVAISGSKRLEEIELQDKSDVDVNFLRLAHYWPRVKRLIVSSYELSVAQFKCFDLLLYLEETSIKLKRREKFSDKHIENFLSKTSLTRVKIYGNLPGSYPDLMMEIRKWQARKCIQLA